MFEVCVLKSSVDTQVTRLTCEQSQVHAMFQCCVELHKTSIYLLIESSEDESWWRVCRNTDTVSL